MKKALKWILMTLISIPIVLVIAYYFLIFIYIKWHDNQDNKIRKMSKFDKSLWMKVIKENGDLDSLHDADCT